MPKSKSREKELLRLKEDHENNVTRTNRKQGEIDSHLKDLDKRYGVKSLKEARQEVSMVEKKMVELEKKLDKLSNRIDKLIKEDR